MEGESRSWYGGYWKRRKYVKLNGSSRRRRRTQVELGSTPTRRRLWRIKISPKLRLLRKIPSPRKLLVWLRDAYVKMMLRFANSRVFAAGYGGSVGAFGQRPVKEYDEKIIVEIYKSMVAAAAQAKPDPKFREGEKIKT